MKRTTPAELQAEIDALIVVNIEILRYEKLAQTAVEELPRLGNIIDNLKGARELIAARIKDAVTVA